MAEDYDTKQGDCISSIAYEHGFFWETLWNHAANSGLKQKRKDPNVLMEGDVVHIPDLSLKEELSATEKRHKFKLKGVPAKLRLRLLDKNQSPRANLAYLLKIDGDSFQGKTDPDGRIEHGIPPNAQRATLTIKVDGRDEKYDLGLGHVDPVTEPSGVQQRLLNLGYDCRPGDMLTSDRTKSALKMFQKRARLPETGEADDTTRQKLKDAHGS